MLGGSGLLVLWELITWEGDEAVAEGRSVLSQRIVVLTLRWEGF